jgi:two-component system, response regulator
MPVPDSGAGAVALIIADETVGAHQGGRVDENACGAGRAITVHRDRDDAAGARQRDVERFTDFSVWSLRIRRTLFFLLHLAEAIDEPLQQERSDRLRYHGPMAASRESLPPVLIVDDDPDDQFLLCDRLRKAGIENPLLTFGRADKAMAFLTDAANCGPPCLVLTDLRMPGIDGFQLTAWIRAQAVINQLPVVILSDADEPTGRVRAVKVGVTAYYPKFPRLEALASHVPKRTRSFCA